MYINNNIRNDLPELTNKLLAGLKYAGINNQKKDVVEHQKYLEESAKKLENVSFDIKRDENLKSDDISFEDYQYLNEEAIDIIFGKDTEESFKASRIMIISTMTNDKILNKIYYDKLTETIDDNQRNVFEMTQEAVGILDLRLAGEPEKETFFQSRAKDGYSITKENMFAGFDAFKESLNDKSRTWQIDTNAVIKAMDEIKTEYEKRVKENESLLKELTKNNKPNPLENIESSDG